MCSRGYPLLCNSRLSLFLLCCAGPFGNTNWKASSLRLIMAHTWSMNCFWGLNGGYSRLNSIWRMVSPFSLKLGFVDRLRRIQHWVFVLVSTLPGTVSQLFWIQPKIDVLCHHFRDLDFGACVDNSLWRVCSTSSYFARCLKTSLPWQPSMVAGGLWSRDRSNIARNFYPNPYRVSHFKNTIWPLHGNYLLMFF